jgi:hypothetical protein
MEWYHKFYTIDIDMSLYRKKMLAYVREINKRAGRAWIKEVIKGTPIPTWSGASRATFTKLARDLGTVVPIGPIQAPTRRVGLGAASSKGSGIIEDSSKNDLFIGFKYTTNLKYLVYNEYNKATAGKYPRPYSNRVRFTPYNFQPRAADAWREVAKEARLPDPYDYITRKRI